MIKEKFRKKTIGTRTFGSEVDITDPGYDKDTWCRMNAVKILPGNYSCITWLHKHLYEYNGKKCTVQHVGIIGIYFGGIIPSQKSMYEMGTIGVDSGLAGFFENKPDYTNSEWKEFCDRVYENEKERAWIIENGFFSKSGFGDGGYSVYAHENKDGFVTALEIRFI